MAILLLDVIIISIFMNILLFIVARKIKIKNCRNNIANAWQVGTLNNRISQLEVELNFSLKLLKEKKK